MHSQHHSIFKAIKTRNHTKLLSIITEDASAVNQYDTYGLTPLHCAAALGDTWAVKFLLENGAYLNAQSTETHSTALHKAAYYGHPQTYFFLKQRGADRRIENHAGDRAKDIWRSSPKRRSISACVAALTQRFG